MDLIDRDAVLSDINEEIEANQEYPEDKLIRKGLRIARKCIENVPAVNRCIPCSERLPEKSGLYLTYQKELGRFQLMRYSPVLRNGTGWFDDNYGLYVTHWMPLPEPPESDVRNG